MKIYKDNLRTVLGADMEYIVLKNTHTKVNILMIKNAARVYIFIKMVMNLRDISIMIKRMA